MHADTLPAARPAEPVWAAKTLTLLLLAAFALLWPRAALAQATFSIGTNLMDISQFAGNETDPSIAINPANPSNMVVVATTDGVVPGLFLTWTTDMGGSWTTNFVATGGDSLTPAYGEASVAFDSYGNLFLAYLPDTFQGVAVAFSVNGGNTFAPLTNLAALDVTDQPRITAPPSGAAQGSVWVAYKNYSASTTPLQVQGMLSTGLGSLGTFAIPQIVPGSSNGGFADIAVGPLGQAMVTFQDNLEAATPANIWVSVESNAIANGKVSTSGFGAAKKAATTAIGGLTYIDAAPSGIGVNAAPGLAWDYNVNGTNYGKVYLIYTAVGPNNNAVIGFMSSSNSGTAWSAETFVNDDATTGGNDHFLPRLAVDPTTGIICCSWYDCRNDLGSSSQTIPNDILDIVTNNFTFPNMEVTNVLIGNNVPYVSAYWFNLNGEGTSNLITIVATNVTGTLMAANTTEDALEGLGYIFIFGFTPGGSGTQIEADTNVNFELQLETPTNQPGSAKVTVILTNLYPEFYTSGSGPNKEAVMYTTLSFNGGMSFLPNEPLISSNEVINYPAVGIASEAARSDSVTGWGRYTALAAYGANFFPLWADNSDVTTNNPDGITNFDLYMLNAAGGQPSISVAVADLSIWVADLSTNPIISGEEITYTVIVTNNGPKTAAPVTVTNILSPYVTLLPNGVTPALGGTYRVQTVNGQNEVVFTWPSVADGTVLTSTIRVDASTGGSFTNFASVYSPLYDLVPANTTNMFVLTAAGEDLSVGMTTSETNVLIGDTVLTWVTVTNLGPASNGPVFLTNVFSSDWTGVTVQAPGTNLVTGGTAFVNLGLLSVGQSVTAMFTAVAGSDSTSASQTATVSSSDFDPNLANNSASLSYFVNGEYLAVGFASTNPTVELEQPATYVIYLTNLGLSYSGTITVTGTFSANFHLVSASQSQGTSSLSGSKAVFNIGVLGAGQVASMAVSTVAVSGPALVTNTLALSSTDLDTDKTNNTAKQVVNITPVVPMISNLVVAASASSAIITWDTASPATAQVFYGPTTNYGSFSPVAATPTNHHIVFLSGLTGATNYDFEALSLVGSQLYTTNGSFSLITSNGLILNTQNALYSGSWTGSSVAAGLYGTYYQYATTTPYDPTSWAVYTPTIPVSGLYNVSIWHPQNATFTTNAQVYVTGATNEFIVSVNETANGGGWQPLATNMYFTAGTGGNVTLFNDTGVTNGYLVANAMMWAYSLAQDSPTNGTVPAWWANAYFGTNVSVSGSADPDGDGYSNYAEYVFGTDPNNAASHLVFTVSPVSSNTVSVTFSPCQGGRAYSLLAATHLANPIWTTLTNGFVANTNGSGTFIVSQTNPAPAFYRLSAYVIP